MKRRMSLLIIIIFVSMFFAAPFYAIAGPSIEQVEKNVENLWKKIRESQPHVTVAEFKKIMESGQKIVLVDVRTDGEYAASHLPGAIHINRGLIEWVMPQTVQDTDAKIYVYCRTGARSAFATERLKEMGYTSVTNIYDGFQGWVVAGYPVYNRHGEFTLKPQAFEKKDPYIIE